VNDVTINGNIIKRWYNSTGEWKNKNPDTTFINNLKKKSFNVGDDVLFFDALRQIDDLNQFYTAKIIGVVSENDLKEKNKNQSLRWYQIKIVTIQTNEKEKDYKNMLSITKFWKTIQGKEIIGIKEIELIINVPSTRLLSVNEFIIENKNLSRQEETCQEIQRKQNESNSNLFNLNKFEHYPTFEISDLSIDLNKYGFISEKVLYYPISEIYTDNEYKVLNSVKNRTNLQPNVQPNNSFSGDETDLQEIDKYKNQIQADIDSGKIKWKEGIIVSKKPKINSGYDDIIFRNEQLHVGDTEDLTKTFVDDYCISNFYDIAQIPSPWEKFWDERESRNIIRTNNKIALWAADAVRNMSKEWNIEGNCEIMFLWFGTVPYLGVFFGPLIRTASEYFTRVLDEFITIKFIETGLNEFINMFDILDCLKPPRISETVTIEENGETMNTTIDTIVNKIIEEDIDVNTLNTINTESSINSGVMFGISDENLKKWLINNLKIMVEEKKKKMISKIKKEIKPILSLTEQTKFNYMKYTQQKQILSKILNYDKVTQQLLKTAAKIEGLKTKVLSSKVPSNTRTVNFAVLEAMNSYLINLLSYMSNINNKKQYLSYLINDDGTGSVNISAEAERINKIINNYESILRQLIYDSTNQSEYIPTKPGILPSYLDYDLNSKKSKTRGLVLNEDSLINEINSGTSNPAEDKIKSKNINNAKVLENLVEIKQNGEDGDVIKGGSNLLENTINKNNKTIKISSTKHLKNNKSLRKK
jgi:hypothetical protein